MWIQEGVSFDEKVVTSSHRSGFCQKLIDKVDPKSALFRDLLKNMEIPGNDGHGDGPMAESGRIIENNRLFSPKTPIILSKTPTLRHWCPTVVSKMPKSGQNDENYRFSVQKNQA